MGARFDRIYKDIVDTIAEKGIWSEGNVRTKYADGTAAHYKSYIGYQFRLDNSDDEAHLITSRFAPSKAAISFGMNGRCKMVLLEKLMVIK